MARRKVKRDIEEELDDVIVPDVVSEGHYEEEVARNKKKLMYQNLLSMGSTMLNLASSNTSHGTLLKGKYYLLVGASGSGKTWLSMCTFAESTLHPRFKKYLCIYDNKEEGSNMDWGFYFGDKTAKRIEPPEPKRKVAVKDAKGKPTGDKMSQPNSNTVEEFYDSCNRRLDQCEREGRGMIYILDSMDSLTSEMELNKAEENRKLRKSEKETKGAMADGKAKANSVGLRQLMHRLERTGSILIIVCQERDNLSSPHGGKTMSGGNALPFYATSQFWLKVKSEIKPTIKGKARAIGTWTKIMIKKNRLTGQKEFELLMPIYHSFGMDDIGAMIEWLISEKHWAAAAAIESKFDAPEFKQKATKREALARYIDDNDLVEQLAEIATDHWDEIQESILNKVKRRRRYS